MPAIERREDDERQQGQPPVVEEEDPDDAEEGQAVDHQRGHAVGDQLVEGLDVVGQPAHRPAGRHALVVAELEPHEVLEGVGAQVEQHALAHPGREVGLAGSPRRQPTRPTTTNRPTASSSMALSRGSMPESMPNWASAGPARPQAGHHQHQEHGEDGPPAVGAEVGEELAQLAPRVDHRAHVVLGIGQPAEHAGGRAGAGRTRAHATRSGRARPPSWMLAVDLAGVVELLVGAASRHPARPPARPARRPARSWTGGGR